MQSSMGLKSMTYTFFPERWDLMSNIRTRFNLSFISFIMDQLFNEGKDLQWSCLRCDFLLCLKIFYFNQN